MQPENLDSNILYLIGEITHILHRNISEAFREHQFDETVEQFSILALLFYREGINQQEISAYLNRDKTTITRVIGNMARKDLIVRRPDNDDQRIKRIYLTSLGKTRQNELIHLAGNEYSKATKGIDTRDFEIALQVLRQIKTQLTTTNKNEKD